MFNVPKKVNRHVLKAVNALSKGNTRKRLSTGVIINQVKFQMRDLVPVPNVEKAVQKSLKNLSDYGLIKQAGPNRFSISQVYPPPAAKPSSSNAADRSPYRAGGSRKRNASDLDLSTLRRRGQNEGSLSDDELDRTHKRMRSNSKKLRRSGNGVGLPKSRQHYQQYALAYACEDNGCIAGYESDVLVFDHNMTFVSEPTHTHLEPVIGLNMDYELTSFEPVRSLQILDIAGPCQDSALCANIQLTESSKSANSIELTKEQNTAPKEQTEVIQVSTSSAAKPTKTTDGENSTDGSSPESSNIET